MKNCVERVVCRSPLLVTVLALCHHGCNVSGGSGAHELVLNLQTDLAPGDEFAEAEVTLLPLDQVGTSRREFVTPARVPYLPSALLTTLADVQNDSYRVGVSLRTSDGIILVEQPALVDVKESVSLTVRIPRSCLNVRCAVNEACFAGQCVDPNCGPETPEFCGEVALCSDDADCGERAACSVGQCLDGQCFYASKDSGDVGACDIETEWCNPEQGCLPQGLRQSDEGSGLTLENPDDYELADGLALELPAKINSQYRAGFFALATHVVSMPEGRDMTAGIYAVRQRFDEFPLTVPQLTFAPENGYFSGLGSANFAEFADMFRLPDGSGYGGDLVVSTYEDDFAGGPGVSMLDPAGSRTRIWIDDSGLEASALAFDGLGRLFPEFERSLYAFGIVDQVGIYRLRSNGRYDFLPLDSPSTYVTGFSIPQSGSLQGAAFLLFIDSIIRLTASDDALVADPDPWLTTSTVVNWSLVHASSESFVGEGFLTIDNFAGEVRLIRPDKSSKLIVGGLLNPVDIDLSEDEQSLLILERDRGQVLRLRAAP